MPTRAVLSSLRPKAKPLTSQEGRAILERDQYRCRYCGLDGMARFEDSLVMTVDFIMPRMRKGRKDPSNLATACRPCNLIKGNRIFHDFESAKAYVVARRAELQREWEAKLPKGRPASA